MKELKDFGMYKLVTAKDEIDFALGLAMIEEDEEESVDEDEEQEEKEYQKKKTNN